MSDRRARVLIAEDEDLARERLARMVGERSDCELIATCRNGSEALAVLATREVDIALLDIEMPGLDGMDLLRRTGVAGAASPLVVFVTAHPRFAVDAFAGEAVDYVLKPFDGERLGKALNVARERLESRAAVQITARIRTLMDGAGGAGDQATRAAESASSGRLVVRESGRLHIVREEQIDWIEADGRHCLLHCGKERHRVEGPLTELGTRLCAGRFVQISRSALINVDRVRELQEMFKGTLIAVLKSGAEVTVSRRYRKRLLQWLGERAAP